MRINYFKRNIDHHLLAWKNSRNRKPLLVRGARQIGKSRSIRNLGKSFKYFIEVNFETQKNMIGLFKQEYNAEVICERLSILYSTPVIPGETLLFFDEIQCCDEALNMLWAFKENLPDLHVIAAGSLLEFALKRMPSYGVGRVSSMFMYPLSFNEFLGAVGKGAWVDEIMMADTQHPLFETLHQELVSIYRTFLLVGGMPACVRAWVETGDYNECIIEQADIQQTYYDDFSKYNEKVPTDLLRNTLQSVIGQTGHKFTFSKVNGGYTPDQIRKALSLLSDAGIVKPVCHTAANVLPLGAEINEKFVKYLYLDNGLLLRVLDLDFGGSEPIKQLILAGTEADLVNKGSLAELSVGWEMVKSANLRHRYDLYYWENLSQGTTSEVDYVIPSNLKILPIEVKSGTSGKMKSLRLFMQKEKIDRAIRTSLENFSTIEYQQDGTTRQIEILPIYAIGRLTNS